jgi:hypothetical protein
MKSRIFATDGLQNLAHRIATGHDFVVAANIRTQDCRDMYGYNRGFAKHETPPFRWCP